MIKTIGLSALVFFVCGMYAAHAQEQTFFNTTSENIALDGFDVVAYFEDGRAARGSQAHAFEWQGATWYFASDAHLRKFAANAERYAPQYGGWCAMAMGSGRVVEVDLENAWTVDNDKLYFNVSESVRLRWLRGLSRNLRRADAKWPETRDKIASGAIVVVRHEWLPEHY